MVAVESMARGLPLIASRIGGLPYLVDEEISGLLFEPGNPDDLVRKVRRLWDDPQLSDQMGRAGRQKVMQQYNRDAYYHNLMAVYKTAIQRSRNSATVTPLVHINNAVLRSSEIDGR
jgi:glycosyltransferase involved in cell wall biosynthesis